MEKYKSRFIKSANTEAFLNNQLIFLEALCDIITSIAIIDAKLNMFLGETPKPVIEEKKGDMLPEKIEEVQKGLYKNKKNAAKEDLEAI